MMYHDDFDFIALIFDRRIGITAVEMNAKTEMETNYHTDIGVLKQVISGPFY